MKIKKMISSVIALLISFICVGCSGSGAPKEQADTNDLTLYVMDGGYRTEVFYKLAEAFTKKYPEVSIHIYPKSGINEKMTSELSRSNSEVDLWFAGEQNIIKHVETSRECPLEDITDVLNSTADGEETPLINKMNERCRYYNAYVDKNGQTHYYSASFVIGSCGLFYNADYLKNETLPKTTNQLLELFDKIADGKVDGCNTKPLIWTGSSGSSYMSYIVDTWKAQYMGVNGWDTYSNFYDAKTDEYTIDMMNDDAVTYAYEVAQKLGDNRYFVSGSQGYKHTEGQQYFFRGQGVFMPNGDWLANEMKTAIGEGTDVADIRTLQAPIISALGKKLYLGGRNATDDQHEEMLVNLVTAIDEEKTNEEIKGMYSTLSDNQINAVREARNIVYSIGVGHRVYIPSTSDSKTAAKNFIRFFGSDEGGAIWKKYAGSPSPFAYEKQPTDETRNNFQQSQDEILKNATIIYNSIAISPIRAYNEITSDAGVFVQFSQNRHLTAQEMKDSFYRNVSTKWTAMKLMAGV